MTVRETTFRTFEEAASGAGHLLWFETRLFEVMGGWAEVEPDPAVKVTLSAQSFPHAWHAEVWRGRLPVVGSPKPEWRAEALTVPAGEGIAAFMDALAACSGRDQTVERLVAVSRVALPRLAGAYRDHLATADPTSEGPTLRWLPLLVTEEEAAAEEGERLLEPMLRTPKAMERAALHQAELAGLLDGAGLIAGV